MRWLIVVVGRIQKNKKTKQKTNNKWQNNERKLTKLKY